MSTSPHRRPSRPPRCSFPNAQLVFSERVPSTTDAIEPALQRVMQVMNHHGCPDGRCEAIELALREALANAIIHGNRSSARKRVTVDCYRQGEQSILLVVRDQGTGFDPSCLGNPTAPENIYRAGGRGIFLIRHFVDEVEFSRGGREIRMRKKLSSHCLHRPSFCASTKPQA
jgi:serine/threonine-protein kinase RsbW